MPLSKARMRERKRQDRLVKPASNLVMPVKPNVKPESGKIDFTGRARGGLSVVGLIDSTPPIRHEEGIPLYNPAKHRAGDKVRMSTGQIVVIPELDADGQRIW